MKNNEVPLESHPWVTEFIDCITQISKENALNWSNIVIRLGVNIERQNRELENFKKTIINQYQDLIGDMAAYEIEFLNEKKELFKIYQSFSKILGKEMPACNLEGLTIYDAVQHLRNTIVECKNMIKSKSKEIINLNQQHLNVCTALGRLPSPLPSSEESLPSFNTVKTFIHNLVILENEKEARLAKFREKRDLIQKYAKELQYQPSNDFEKAIISAGSDFYLTDANMGELDRFYNFVKIKYNSLEMECVSLRETLKKLWEFLNQDPLYCEKFLEMYNCNNIITFNDKLKTEIECCEALKMENINVKLGEVKKELLEFWEKCQISENCRSNEFTQNELLHEEDLLSKCKTEIEKMKTYYSNNRIILDLLIKHKRLSASYSEFNEQNTAAKRHKNRGGQLLVEERKRNVLFKKLYKLEEILLELCQAYKLQHGTEFLSWGQTIDSLIKCNHSQVKQKIKTKLK